MYQRLLFLLSVVFISGAAMAQNVMTPNEPCYKYDKNASPGSLTNPNVPAANVMSKWVHDPSQNAAGRSGGDTIGGANFWNNYVPFDQSTYKCYMWNGMAFRLRFPVNYNPANKYPLVLFLHGAGEAAHLEKANNQVAGGGTINRENQDHLYWGAQLFEQRLTAGEWNGFILFPQLTFLSQQWDHNTNMIQVNGILDTLQKYNGFDPDRLTVMGLSAGGEGAFDYAIYFPKRVAATIPSVPEQPKTAGDNALNFIHIPVWMCAGGLDGGTNGCDPANMFYTHDKFINAGGNMFLTYSVNEGHVMWNTQWNQLDVGGDYILSKYWNTAHKAQPLLYFQNDHFCTGQPVNAKMGITPGYNDYQWQFDNGSGFVQVASGINANEYTASQAGKYRVRFQRLVNGPWSDWTPNPVVITTNACPADTAFVEHFDLTRDWYAAAEYKPYSFSCQNGIVTESTDGFRNPGTFNDPGSISQDGAGIMGGKFLLGSTTSNCTYGAGDQVYRNYVKPVNVQPNTDYLLSFSMANQNNFFSGGTGSSLAASLSATVNNVVVTPVGGVKASGVGNSSWKTYSFKWNSGNSSNPEIAIFNNQTSTTWNDFVLDEVMLVKYKAPAMPGAAFKNFTLWAKANSINATDGTGVGLWTNNDVNGDNLGQPAASAVPVLKNNAADNINFNPVVNFNAANGQFMQAPAGFSGSATHTAVTAYVVAKFNTLAQNDKNILIENQLTQTQQKTVKVTLNSNGRISFTAGLDPNYTNDFSNTLTTANNTIEINKPIVWSFSKDNNGTASSFKQDIRKNGIVVASNSTSSTFTGNGTAFGLSNGGQFFDGNIAEVIYLLDSTVTPLTQNKIESYLALKYGTTMGNTTNASTRLNYTASDGTTVFWTGDAKFQNDIFGIGRDSASGLVQKISNSVNSGSGDGTGQTGRGNLVLSTNTNLLDKQFLMIGNSQATLTQHVIVSGESNLILVGSTRVGRNWKVRNTGGVGAVTLSFDTTGLGLQAGNTVNKYALLMNINGDTTYPSPVSTFTASSIVGKKIIFSGVTLQNGAVFTILTNNLNFALPAVWLGFTAEAVNGNGVLNWKTSDEINVDRYTVEHSYDGVSFSAVGFVMANNSTGVNNYTLTHSGLAPGIHYYRIRRTDRDGKFEFSDIKSIKITTTGANVQVRPNPVVGSSLVLGVSVQQSSKTTVQVMAVDGKILLQQKVTLTSGNNLVNLDIANLPSGVYMVQLQLTDEVVTKKFIRQR